MKNITVTVTGGADKQTVKELKDKLLKKYGDDCRIKVIINDGIIGGFIADIDGEIIDSSISSKLKRAREHLL